MNLIRQLPGVDWEKVISYIPSYPPSFLWVVVAEEGPAFEWASQSIKGAFLIPFEDLPKWVDPKWSIWAGVARYRLEIGK